MYIKRIAEQSLSKILSGKKIGIILGARQVGKTTLVEHVLAGQQALFLNFDVEIDKQRFLAAATQSPADALKYLGAPDVLVIDEAQRLPEAARVVKGWHDWIPKADLLRHFAAPIRICLLETMAYGCYPEVVLETDKSALLRNLSSDYLWKDILQNGLVRAPDSIKRLLMLLAHQTGAEVSLNELGTQLGMTRATVERYLDLLEQTFVVFRLPAYSTNPRKEIAKGRKIYFWDTGIRNALLNTFSMDELRPDIGALWENWVIAEIAKHNLLQGAASDLYFWRTHSQAEVDLVIKTGDRLRAFEIKWRIKRPPTRAFQAAYGVEVEMLDAANPFLSGILETADS
ncbi:MAG: DUF4143 domain-containing protein [Candidatus Sumerlaeota bacterium]|nr:DUF4143 domain-containing protein [Candidatus Sumerlaeota bacterium]